LTGGSFTVSKKIGNGKQHNSGKRIRGRRKRVKEIENKKAAVNAKK